MIDRSQMTCLFLYNPNSGKGKLLKKLNYIKRKLCETYKNVTVIATQSLEDTLLKAKLACGSYDVLAFSGGDGTFNNIVNAISGEKNRPILGYIPSGTVNDIAKNFKISRRINQAIKVIQKGNIHPFDIGKVNDQYFVYVLAMGSFAHVSYDTDQKIKRKYGKVAYYLRVLKEVLKKYNYQTTIHYDENQTYDAKTPLILVLNSASVGGFLVNKKCDLNDGKFDVLIMYPGFASGLFNVLSKRKHKHILTSKLTIHIDTDMHWCIDGEKGMAGDIVIENLHNHLQIFSYKKFKQK